MTDSVFKIYCSTWKMKHRTWAMTKIICIKMLISFELLELITAVVLFLQISQFWSHKHTFSMAISHVLFDLVFVKNYSTKHFHPVYRGFFRLLSATSKDHWVPRILFVILINSTRFFSQQLLLTAFNMC